MEFILKITKAPKLDERSQDIIDYLCKRGKSETKITTNKLNIEYDKKNQTLIKTIKDIKLIYKLKHGCLLLLGNIGCSFKDGFVGEFFIKKIIVEENTEYESVKGAVVNVEFNPLAANSNDIMYSKLNELSKSPNLVYNIDQFEDFMNLFEFYKKISSELNNNMNFKIESCSKKYCFLPIDIKSSDIGEFEDVYNDDKILIGYKFEEYKYDQLDSQIRELVRFLVDIEIECDINTFKKIRKVGFENIYLSNSEVISEKEINRIEQFQTINFNFRKEKLILSGEVKNGNYDYAYLNLYDMGQRIKVESIDNSLKLIKEGASGSASELLRYIIGDEKMPNFNAKTDEIKEKYMEGLNESQRNAFLMAVDGSPVSLIKGPPGTGKTHVINAIVQYVTKELKEKVIVSSQTHIAIDNVLDKLMCNHDIVIPNRITNRRNRYSDNEIDNTLYKTWGLNFESHNKKSSNKTLAKEILKSMEMFKGEKKFAYSNETNKADYMVIGATTTTSAIAGKKGLEILKGYDWLVIDEVSKCPITEVLRYLPYVKRIIMVGDDYQLAPLLEFNKEDVLELPSYNADMFEKLKEMYENSVFAKTLTKAKESNRLVLLNENYRSVGTVLQLYNVFYDNELIGKRESVKPEKVQIKSNVISNDKDVYFVEVKYGKEAMEGTSRYNLEEITATSKILEDLVQNIINPEIVSVAAIFPYAAQISHFQRENQKLINVAKQKFKSFEIDTVDAFQGKEADVVLCNTVVADASRKNFLNDFRRINVSMSRAKDKLILFGNSNVLSKIEMCINERPSEKYLRKIIDYIKISGEMIIYEGGKIHETSSKSSIEFA